MKKIQIMASLLVLMVVFLGIIAFKNKDSSENNNTIFQFSSQMNEIKSIDDLVQYSDNVIIGTVIKSEDFSTFENKYTVSVDKSYKGKINSTDIDVYEAKDSLQQGKQYILFLGYFDSTLYPREVYTSIEKRCIFEIVNGLLIGDNNFTDKNTKLDSFVKKIEKSAGLKHNNKRDYNIKNKYDTLEDIKEASDCIIHISVNSLNKINKYVSNAQVNVIQQYKGDIYGINQFLLPSDTEIGKEYLLFLTRTSEGSLVLSARKGSIINKDNIVEWNKVIGALSTRM